MKAQIVSVGTSIQFRASGIVDQSLVMADSICRNLSVWELRGSGWFVHLPHADLTWYEFAPFRVQAVGMRTCVDECYL